MYEDILSEWNPWWSKSYSYKGIKRIYLDELKKLMSLKHIIALLGVRRAGKTHMIYQLISEMISKKIDSSKILFLKIDDLRIKQNLDHNKISSIIEEYKMLKNPKGKTYIFFDEIQELPNWQQYLKTLYDLNEDYKIIVTGSNAHMLKKDVSDYLTGRIIEKRIFPFSFKEYLTAKNIDVSSKEKVFDQKIKVKKEFKNFIFKGGFPEVIGLDEDLRINVLKEYLQTIIFKDVVARYSVSNSQKILDFAHYIISNSTKLFNFSTLAKQFSYSNDTVSEYASYFEEVFFIFRLFIHDYSVKKQLVNPKKLYAIDTGIITASSFRFSENTGRLLENAVFVELIRRGNDIYYHNGKKECDFIVKEDIKIVQAIQVSSNLDDSDTKKREIEGLLDAMENYGLDEGLILVADGESEEIFEDKKIIIKPIWKFFLGI